MLLFQNIYGVLFRPDATFKQLNTNYSPSLILQGLLVLLLVAMINEEPSSFGVISYFSSWFIASTFIFIMAFIFKLRVSDYPRFMVMLAFANSPLMFLAPIDIVSGANFILGGFFKLIVVIWTFNLNLIAISSSCQITKVRALLIYLLPLLILILVFIKIFFSLFTLI